MIVSRKDGQEQVNKYKEVFKPFINRAGTISFDTHILPITLLDITLANTTGMTNAPDKRLTSDGKNKTPLVMQLTTDAGNLFFILDDIVVSSLTNGFRITLDKTIVDMRF